MKSSSDVGVSGRYNAFIHVFAIGKEPSQNLILGLLVKPRGGSVGTPVVNTIISLMLSLKDSPLTVTTSSASIMRDIHNYDSASIIIYNSHDRRKMHVMRDNMINTYRAQPEKNFYTVAIQIAW